MSKIIIKTNNHKHNLLSFYELPIKEQKYYISLNESFENSNYFKYRGSYYILNDFFSVVGDNDFKKYDYVLSDSYFSGILIKFCDNYESVIVASFYQCDTCE